MHTVMTPPQAFHPFQHGAAMDGLLGGTIMTWVEAKSQTLRTRIKVESHAYRIRLVNQRGDALYSRSGAGEQAPGAILNASACETKAIVRDIRAPIPR